MYARAAAWLLRIVGAAFALVGLLFDPWVLSRYVLLDGQLERWPTVLAVELALVAVGVRVFFAARSPPLPRRAAFAAVASAGAALVAFGAGELALRLLLDPARVLRGDALWEFEWRRAHAAGELHRPVTFPFDRYDPRLGWRPAPGYDSADVRVNAQGFRSDRAATQARTPGRVRIVTVGDSYTWGEEVANADTYPVQLEQLLPGSEVLNFGVHGYGIDQAVLRLREEALAYRPDVVVLGFIEDDVGRDVLSFRSFAKPRFVLDGNALRLTNVPVPTPEEVLARPQVLPCSWLGMLARTAADDVLDRTRLRPREAREDWRVTAAVLDDAARASEGAGARFVLAYFPGPWDARPVAAEELAASWAQRSGASFVDLREAFAALPEARRTREYQGVHWSPEGNRLAARVLRDALAERGLLGAGREGAGGPRLDGPG